MLTRGGGRLPAEADQHGVIVHRRARATVPEGHRPRSCAGSAAMNGHMHARAAELCDRIEFDLVHSHDWLVAGAAEQAARGDRAALARHRARHRVRPPPGLGPEPPAVPHPRRRARDGARRRPRDHLLAVHAGPRGQRVRRPPGEDHRDPERDRPARPGAGGRRPAGAARAVRRRPTSCSCCWSAGSSTRRASTSRSTRSRRSCAGAAASASWSPARAPPRPSSSARPGGWACRPRRVPRLGRRRHAPLALPRSPTSASCPRSTSRSGSWRSRRWRRGACAWSPTPAACARSFPVDGTVGLRFPSRDSAALRGVLERVLTDDAERAQLVAEAREHVLRFDWAEVARRTARGLPAC